MKVKTVINSKGEQAGSRIEIPIEGAGGELDMHAVKCLVNIIGDLQNQKTPEEITAHLYIIHGFVLCCGCCGFLSKESLDDITNMAEEMAEIMYKKAEGMTTPTWMKVEREVKSVEKNRKKVAERLWQLVNSNFKNDEMKISVSYSNPS